MKRLDNKVVVVTGGSTGIGLAAATRFAAEGARVFVFGRRLPELEKATAAIGDGAIAVQGDISKLADLDRLFDRVREAAGKLDVLFANAGGGSFSPLSEVDEAHYASTFDTNVKGTLFTVQKSLPVMVDGGSIILTGSTAGSVGTPAFSAYSASKAAIRNFARSWILELAARSIRVNVLSPGATSTPGWHGLASSQAEEDAMIAAASSGTPLGRLGTVDEIANAALFLASDESSFVNGSELFVDGGTAQV